MSSNEYYKYRLKCTTEDTYKYWILDSDEDAPTLCPTNTAHTIDSLSLTIIETFSKNKVKVQEETIETGANFATTSGVINVTGATGSSVIKDQSWPIPISAMELQFATEECHRGDKMELIVAPDTIIGALAAHAATGATGITVTQTVIDNTMIGYHLELYDGAKANDLGRVIAIDKINNVVTPEFVPTNGFLATTPTYVRQNIYMIHDYYFGTPQRYVIGESKIGGSNIPANITVRSRYTNITGGDKCIVIQIEYLY